MFDYNIYPNNNPEKFRDACALIERTLPGVKKERLLIDVDGTAIQRYNAADKKVTVYDDYEIGAVFVKSEIDLCDLFETFR